MSERSFLSEHPSNSPAYFDGNSGQWFTRADLASRVSAFAEELTFRQKALGFIFARNDSDSVVAYLAAIEAGNAVVMLDAELDHGFKARLISRFEPDFIVEPAKPLWRSREPGRHFIHPDLTLLISTSGSTGSPKLVRLSWRNLESNARSINEVLVIDERDRCIITAPIFNGYGLSVIHTHLLAGGSFVLTRDRIVSHSFWDTARHTQCNSIGGTPYFYQVLDRLDLDSLNVPSLAKFVQIGGRLPENLARKYHAAAVRREGTFHIMYGQAEATARISGLPPELLPEAARSIGFALPGGRLSVDDDGELRYEGPNVMMGYATNASDFGEGDLLHGKLSTGDLGYVDERGLFYITGRKARFVKLFGWRISLDDVEEMLSDAGPVAAVNEQDRIVVYCENVDARFSQRVQIMAARLRIHQSGFEVRHIGTIPRLANGKTDYHSLTLDPVAR